MLNEGHLGMLMISNFTLNCNPVIFTFFFVVIVIMSFMIKNVINRRMFLSMNCQRIKLNTSSVTAHCQNMLF